MQRIIEWLYIKYVGKMYIPRDAKCFIRESRINGASAMIGRTKPHKGIQEKYFSKQTENLIWEQD